MIGAVLHEQNDEWQTQNRSMQVEAMSELIPTETTAAISCHPRPPDQWTAQQATGFPPP
ncbi:Mobile element protein [Azospirillum doebereinerae]